MIFKAIFYTIWMLGIVYLIANCWYKWETNKDKFYLFLAILWVCTLIIGPIRELWTI